MEFSRASSRIGSEADASRERTRERMNIDFSKIPPEGYILLAVSVIAAICADYAIMKFGLDFLKPASAYAFLLGRVGKLVSFVGWVLFINNYWYPQFLGQAQPMPGFLPMVEWGLVAVMAVLAFTTYPRVPQTLGAGK